VRRFWDPRQYAIYPTLYFRSTRKSSSNRSQFPAILFYRVLPACWLPSCFIVHVGIQCLSRNTGNQSMVPSIRTLLFLFDRTSEAIKSQFLPLATASFNVFDSVPSRPFMHTSSLLVACWDPRHHATYPYTEFSFDPEPLHHSSCNCVFSYHHAHHFVFSP
jgi:hypothetical protein